MLWEFLVKHWPEDLLNNDERDISSFSCWKSRYQIAGVLGRIERCPKYHFSSTLLPFGTLMNKPSTENNDEKSSGATASDSASTNATSPSRRDFMKKSSLLVAGGALASSAGIAQGAHVAGSDVIKIGLVGCGGRGTGATAHALSTDGPTKVVAVSDVFDYRLEGCLKELAQFGEQVDVPKERQFVGFDGFQKVLDSDIDLVIIATPPGFRPQHFEAAVKAGVHIFMEKPLAVDAAGVRRVLETNKIAKEKNLAVAVGLQRRHQTNYREMISRVHEGMIGDIVSANVYWNMGSLWERSRKPGQSEMEYQMQNWYYFNWLCGDHIVEQHIHNLDVINWAKQAYPVSAQGMGGRQFRKGRENGQIFDHHFVEYTYADGSIMTSQCRQIPDCTPNVSEHAVGSKGTLSFAKEEITSHDGKVLWTGGKKYDDMYKGEKVGGHHNEHLDLFPDLRAGRIPNEADYGAMSTMTAILGRMATYSGKEISMVDALASEVVVSHTDDFTSFADTPPVVPDARGRYPLPMPGKTVVM